MYRSRGTTVKNFSLHRNRNTQYAIRNTRYGFTLIELIIVATIITIMVALSSPLFRNTFKDLELKDAAYNIGKIIQYGQYRAIIEERKYRLCFDFEKNSYRLSAESEKAVGEYSAADSEENTTSADWENATGRFGKLFYLPDGAGFRSEADKITFLPNGRCGKMLLHVFDEAGNTLEIKTNGRAGYVEVSEIAKE